MNLLKSLGWNNFFQQHFKQLQLPDGTISRVIGAYRNAYTLCQEESSELSATISGKFQHHAQFKSDFPVIGDWVIATNILGENRAIITHILPRQTKLARQVQLSNGAESPQEEQIMAANVDIVFIVSSLNLDLNLRRLERYISMVAESGARAVILLTKSDLCEDVVSRINEVKSVAYSTPIHAISAHENVGLEQLSPYLLAGQTCVLVGSSGTGKSTLVNWLMGKEQVPVNEIRASDDKGKHTTTHRELYFLSEGSMIIDTPGIRALQIEEASTLESTFAEISSLAVQCRFANCQHLTEPGCAVKAAIAGGTIAQTRLSHYHKLSREMAFVDRHHNKEEERKFRQSTKKFTKGVKQIMKDKKYRNEFEQT